MREALTLFGRAKMSAPLGTSFRIACGTAGLVAGFGLALLFWLLLPVSSPILPPPAAVWAQIQDQNMLWAAFQFLILLVPAFLKAIVYGITAGIVISLSQTLAAIAYPILRVWRQLPFIALIPLLFIWIGLSLSQSDVLPIVAMSLVIAVRTVETFSSAISKDAVQIRGMGWLPESGELLRRAPRRIFPSLREAFRVGASLIVAAQLLGSASGIGNLLMLSMQVFDTAKVVAAVLIIWAIFIAGDVLLSSIEYIMRSRRAE
jgi:ABC-type nitrate/sulfonate/bicarbonate transport system permease component